LDLKWIAFVEGGNIFNSTTLNWLGPYVDGSLIDTTGKPVAWLENTTPVGTFKPIKPFKPFDPFKPFKPFNPLGGWSNLTFKQWLAQ